MTDTRQINCPRCGAHIATRPMRPYTDRERLDRLDAHYRTCQQTPQPWRVEVPARSASAAQFSDMAEDTDTRAAARERLRRLRSTR